MGEIEDIVVGLSGGLVVGLLLVAWLVESRWLVYVLYLWWLGI